jgi:hypothetical protein
MMPVLAAWLNSQSNSQPGRQRSRSEASFGLDCDAGLALLKLDELALDCIRQSDEKSNQAEWWASVVLRFALIWMTVVTAMALSDVPNARAGVILITHEEASLPAPKEFASSRAITRGPRIDVSEVEDSKLQSPFHFRLKFRTFGGATIDTTTLAVTYLRGSNIDLTPRVKPFVRSTGIDIPNAEVPPGKHAIRVDLRDSEGRGVTVSFLLDITAD